MDDVQALAALQVNGVLSERIRLRDMMATCPHCHQGFGSASLAIHVRRCRALLPPTEEEEVALEAAEQENQQPKRTTKMRSLVDLCLRFVTKHFESICMDKIVAFPEAEAALIASMPRNLVHRMVVVLVKESKRVKTKSRESRAMIETLENALQGARRDVAQLESARDWAAISRARMAEQQQVSERIQRELEATKKVLSSAEAENNQLRSKAEGAEKTLLRLEAKINTLTAEKTALKKDVQDARRRETEAMRELTSVTRALPVRKNGSRQGSCLSKSYEGPKQRPSRQKQSPVPCRGARGGSSITSATTTAKLAVYRKRPRADGSKIPYPASAGMQISQQLNG